MAKPDKYETAVANEHDGRTVAKKLGANHHGMVVACCSRGQQMSCRTLCWGVLRWHGSAGDGALLCEGHFADAEGEGYRRPPTPRQRRHARKEQR